MQGMEGKGTIGEGDLHGSLKEARNEPPAYGPLDIKRYLKEDNRALILYTLREREEA
jgi:hypothetical protein